MCVFTGPWVGSPCMAGDPATRIPQLSLAAAEPFVLGRRGRPAGAAFLALYQRWGAHAPHRSSPRVMLLFQVKVVPPLRCRPSPTYSADTRPCIDATQSSRYSPLT